MSINLHTYIKCVTKLWKKSYFHDISTIFCTYSFAKLYWIIFFPDLELMLLHQIVNIFLYTWVFNFICFIVISGSTNWICIIFFSHKKYKIWSIYLKLRCMEICFFSENIFYTRFVIMIIGKCKEFFLRFLDWFCHKKLITF